MENWECWEQNKQIELEVDRIYAESDKIIFALMHKIADLAINGESSS